MKNYQKFLSENFHFWVVKFSVHLNRHVFVMSYMSMGQLHSSQSIKSNSTCTGTQIQHIQ